MEATSKNSPGLNIQFSGKLAILQRVLPSYRVPFFEMLAGQCKHGLSLAAGKPRLDEAIDTADELEIAMFTPIQNSHIFRNPFYLCWQNKLIPWLQDSNPDALIVEANPRYLSTRSVIQWMKSHSKPVVGWGLGIPGSIKRGNTPRYAFRMRFLRQFDALISYSQRGAEEYRSLGFPADRIFIAHNSISAKPKHPPISRSNRNNHQACLLFVGRLQQRKRVDLLIKACSNLPVGLQPRLVVVGDGPERKALENLAGSIYPASEFLGALHGAQLEPYYLSADLFVLPGTGGLAIQQAMGWSLPIIAAQGDGTQEDLVRRGNGWQIPADNLPELVETLQQALTDIPRLRRMGLESYRIVSEEINLENMVTVFIKTLNQLTSP